MKYMGSKASIAKYILPIILKDRKEGQYYIEPFVGGCNSIDKVTGNRIGADINFFLIAMWKELQAGWVPPKEISREHYSEVRDDYIQQGGKFLAYYIGYVGFNFSYSGKWFGGFAGKVNTKTGIIRNYMLEAFNNMSLQIPKILGVGLINSSFQNLKIPDNSIIYCDIPYKGTTPYKTETFPYDLFYTWCRDKYIQGHKIFISEYKMPKDFTCVWEKEVSSSLRANSMVSGAKKSTEKLFTLA